MTVTYYFDDSHTGSDYSSDWNFDTLDPSMYGSELPPYDILYSTFNNSWAGPTGSGIMNYFSPMGGYESIRYDQSGMPARYLSDNNVWTNYPGAGSGATDWAAVKDPWALGAGVMFGGLDYLQKQKYYKMMEQKMKGDQEWDEEQRRRQRQKQQESDRINAPDPAGVANIGSIVQNRGTYTGYGAPTDYGRVGGTTPRRMWAAEGGRVELPSDYKPGPLNFLRYLLAGRQFPWEATQQQATPQSATSELQRAALGALGHLRGPGKGQADQIHAMLSDGEYVFDADSVSALGDGNNDAGAVALDQMRINLRRHKRAAPASKIPPKAKKPEAYLKKEK